jgi:uncharacterized membrane protein
MAAVGGRRVLAGASVADAEALWYDLGRRPSFIDGLARIERADGDWPAAGGRVVWSSPPGGRNRVVERVVSYEQGVTQRATVEDADIRANQTVRFAQRPEGCEIALELDYRPKREGPAGALTDAIFIRRRLRASLQRTLARFEIELAFERELRS